MLSAKEEDMKSVEDIMAAIADIDIKIVEELEVISLLEKELEARS